MALFSVADLSYVLPVTAIGYVAAVCIGKVFLHETVTNQRWLGTLFIFCGAALVGSTSHNTSTRPMSAGSSPHCDELDPERMAVEERAR
jgi:drug/metabolite transporter (DMT)-like permease